MSDSPAAIIYNADGTIALGLDAQNHAYVAGKSAPGVAPTSNPVSIAGIDLDGLKRAILTDDQGRTVTVTAGSAAARSGFANGNVTTGAVTNVPVMGTTYNEQTTNGQRSIASASAADTAAGTGARKVKITYYDQTGAGPYEETLTLNGTTGVNTVGVNICFICRMEVVEVGSGGVNAGIITLYTAINKGGTTIGTIAVGDNQTFWCHHYVPTEMSCFVTALSGHNNNASNGVLFSLRVKIVGMVNMPTNLLSDIVKAGQGNMQTTRAYGTPLQVVGPARIIAYAQPEGTPTIINRCAFDFYEQAT